MHLYIVRDAFDRITATTELGARQHREFGASLLAIEAGDLRIIVHAVATGHNAHQSAAHLVTDDNYQNKAIAHAMALVPRLDYVGDWHCHPPECDGLSGTDIATAATLFDEHPHRADFLLLLGVPKAAGPVVRAYRVTRAAANPFARTRPRDVDVTTLDYQLIERDHPALSELLGAPLPDLDLDAPTRRAAATPVYPTAVNDYWSHYLQVAAMGLPGHARVAGYAAADAPLDLLDRARVAGDSAADAAYLPNHARVADARDSAAVTLSAGSPYDRPSHASVGDTPPAPETQADDGVSRRSGRAADANTPVLADRTGAHPPRPFHHPAADRIRRELALLRDLGATAELRDASGVLAATIRWHGETYHFIFPPEFPFGAPVLLHGELDSRDLAPLQLRNGWGSLHQLSDALPDLGPVTAAVEHLGHPPRAGMPAVPGEHPPRAGMPAVPGEHPPRAGMPAVPGDDAPRRRLGIRAYLRNHPNAIENLTRYLFGFNIGAVLVNLLWTLSR